jgi:hypothetical protein
MNTNMAIAAVEFIVAAYVAYMVVGKVKAK